MSVFGASAASATTPPQAVVADAGGQFADEPRGFTWNDDGQLVVAMAGSGGESPPTEDTPTSTLIIGPFAGGRRGRWCRSASGCPAALVTGLASSLTATGEVLGAEDVASTASCTSVSMVAGPVATPICPAGYRMADDGSAELVADLSAWARDNPVAAIPADFDPDAGGYSLVVADAGTLWVDDPNGGQILSVAVSDGSIACVADLSDPHTVPTRLALDPEGGVYVGSLTCAVPDGTAQVARRPRRHRRGGVDRVDHGRRRRCR